MAGRAAGRLLPILGWLPFYQRTSLIPDVLAGLAVWAIMVPEGMAYAGIAADWDPTFEPTPHVDSEDWAGSRGGVTCRC
jgi:hypothetical protein